MTLIPTNSNLVYFMGCICFNKNSTLWVVINLRCKQPIDVVPRCTGSGLLKIHFLEILFYKEHHQCVKQFGLRSGPTFCQPWSGSKLFAKVISRRHQKANSQMVLFLYVGFFSILRPVIFNMTLFVKSLYCFGHGYVLFIVTRPMGWASIYRVYCPVTCWVVKTQKSWANFRYFDAII